jgi:hypothetical protein
MGETTQDLSVHIATICSGSISVAAGTLMIASILMFRRYKQIYWRVVLGLAISDILEVLANVSFSFF